MKRFACFAAMASALAVGAPARAAELDYQAAPGCPSREASSRRSRRARSGPDPYASLGEGADQVRGSAVPSIRPIQLAKGLGDNGVVGSICPSDPGLGFDQTMNRIIARIEPKLK